MTDTIEPSADQESVREVEPEFHIDSADEKIALLRAARRAVLTRDMDPNPQDHWLQIIESLPQVPPHLAGISLDQRDEYPFDQAVWAMSQLMFSVAGGAFAMKAAIAAEGRASDVSIIERDPSGVDPAGNRLEFGRTLLGPKGLEAYAPEMRRRVLASVIHLVDRAAMSHGIHIFSELKDALSALNYGEVHPLLAPSRTRQHGKAYTLWRLRLSAVCQVVYLAESGHKKKDALALVAAQYGQPTETINSWSKRIKRELGELLVEQRISGAKFSGGIAKRALREARSIPENRILGFRAIRRDGETYKRVLREITK